MISNRNAKGIPEAIKRGTLHQREKATEREEHFTCPIYFFFLIFVLDGLLGIPSRCPEQIPSCEALTAGAGNYMVMEASGRGSGAEKPPIIGPASCTRPLWTTCLRENSPEDEAFCFLWDRILRRISTKPRQVSVPRRWKTLYWGIQCRSTCRAGLCHRLNKNYL